MITLQAVSVEDIPILFTHQDDPVVRSSGNIPIRERADFFAHWQRLLASDSILKRGIWSDGQLIVASLVSSGMVCTRSAMQLPASTGEKESPAKRSVCFCC